ncbi:hypothetical protein IAI39_11645, partial [Streptococcus pseudopneumoniae]|uniref:hypothetical protein n=1 Tax=Streptococcus pseudopneumoniae TaxID=257758 RepID=UPI0018B08F46
PGVQKNIVDAVGSLADLAPGVAATLITKNPLPMMAFLGGYSKGSAYVDKRQDGYDSDKANVASTYYALAEALPEALPL